MTSRTARGENAFALEFRKTTSTAIARRRNAAIEGVKGSMPTFKVVDSVMSAQRALQQTLAIRDKAVSAYQEITRMAI